MDVLGVVTPLVRGGAQVLHGDQVVELRAQLGVEEREEKGEDGDGQIEVEDERGDAQGETHMYMDDMTGLRRLSQKVHVTQHQRVWTRCALAFMLK